MANAIRVGVGGWSFDPWEETFYPPGVSKAKQLQYMSRRLTAVEVNATYYSSFKPETFAKWRDETPDNFVFSLKAHRFSTRSRIVWIDFMARLKKLNLPGAAWVVLKDPRQAPYVLRGLGKIAARRMGFAKQQG